MATAQHHEAPAPGHSNVDELFTNAAAVLAKLTAQGSATGKHTGTTIHPTELRDAVGLVFLSWKKAGFGISGIAGNGFLVKVSGASTAGGPPVGAPLFVKMLGASVGLSAGFESGESIIVLRTPESVEKFAKAQSMIDLDFGSVAGSDRAMGADKPTVLGSGPVSQYNIASGAMVDLSLSGVKFSVDDAKNHQVYGQGTTAEHILSGTAAPPGAHALLSAVTAAHQKATSWTA